jgi:hypothetical protein
MSVAYIEVVITFVSVREQLLCNTNERFMHPNLIRWTDLNRPKGKKQIPPGKYIIEK